MKTYTENKKYIIFTRKCTEFSAFSWETLVFEADRNGYIIDSRCVSSRFANSEDVAYLDHIQAYAKWNYQK